MTNPINFNDIMNNASIFKKISKEMRRQSNINKKYQRNLTNTGDKSLRGNNELYRKFLIFLRDSKLIDKLVANDFCMSDDQLNDIVCHVYRNKHASSYNSVLKFVNQFQEVIVSDINGKKYFLILFA